MNVTLAPGQTDISKPDLASLQVRLDHAMKDHRAAATACTEANKRYGDTRDAVNKAQEEIDKAIELLRKGAPIDSRWDEADA